MERTQRLQTNEHFKFRRRTEHSRSDNGEQPERNQCKAEQLKPAACAAHVASAEPGKDRQWRQHAQPVIPGPVVKKKVIARVERFAIRTACVCEMKSGW